MKRALSTGKVAQYCYVTGDTVQNWIRSGILPAQRTAGGQYRVRIEDLRQFMTEREMSVEELERDTGEGEQEYCWKYFRQHRRHQAKTRKSCDDCVVKRTLTLKCYELRKHVNHRCINCRAECTKCAYFQQHAQSSACD